MRLSTYARLVMSGAALFYTGMAATVVRIAMGYVWGPYLSFSCIACIVVVVAIAFGANALGRVRCPLCGRNGKVSQVSGHHSRIPIRYSAFLCPQCGWIDSKGFFRLRFFALKDRAGDQANK